MRGRQIFMDSLAAHGVEYIFGNPGTTESPLLDSLADYPNIRYVTALHEGVALGAASYYAQASGRTGIVSLHVAPGLGNAIGMLYCAKRAGSPIIVTAGQQDTRMRLNNPVLGHDLVAMAAPVTKWSVQVEHADEMALVMRRAFKITHDAPSGPVFVALPINAMEQETQLRASASGELFRSSKPDPIGVQRLVDLLLRAEHPVIVCGDDVARAGAGSTLVRIAELIGAPVWTETLRLHNAFPTSHPSARLSLPVDAAGIRKCLQGADVVLLIGGPFFEDVWYAAGGPFPQGARVAQIESGPETLAHNNPLEVGVAGDVALALSGIAKGIETAASPAHVASAAKRNAELAALKERETQAYRIRAQKAWDREPISMPRAMAEIGRSLPDNAILVDESITATLDMARSIDFADGKSYFGARGGGIGQGLPGAVGVKLAQPSRPVVCVSGDGSAMYSIQALWTAAHLGLGIVFVILANGEYRILKHNIDAYRQRFNIASQAPYAHMDLGSPRLGFIEMAAGMGVAGTRVAKPDEIEAAIRAALGFGGPHVVEIAIEGKR